MFVREIKNKNGRRYIQVIEKVKGKYKVRQSFGSGDNDFEVENIKLEAEKWIKEQSGVLEFDFSRERDVYQSVLESIINHKLVGLELTLGKLFNQIGFNQIEDELFRDLVLYRLVYPNSKLKTTEYLYRYQQKSYTEDDVYRYMDKLYESQISDVQHISYKHTLKLFPKGIQVVFYDVTTVYFEIDKEDDLRKTGFSKEGKHQHPQIVLGLLVSKGGYPLAYDIFEGNKFEGHTMIPIINSFKKKYKLDQLIVVADSGLLSKENIGKLEDEKLEYILGARIKNETTEVQSKILALQLNNGESAVIEKGNQRLIITYSDKRAKKDQYNREKGIKRLEKQIKSGKLNKSNINKRGYNKFLQMNGELTVSINQNKINLDKKWDGLKGYITNSKLKDDELIENYRELWQIEKAFRIAKSELKIRPIFHYKQRRIRAHICLNFAAYKVYKELERLLKLKQTKLSPSKVIETAQSIFQIQLKTPNTKDIITKTLLLTDEQKELDLIFDFGC